MLAEACTRHNIRDDGDPKYSKEQQWWQKYCALRRDKVWSAATHLEISNAAISSKATLKLSQFLLGSAAEDILSSLQNTFEVLNRKLGPLHSATRAEREHIMLILRDCCSLELEIKTSWYKLLLEFID